MTAPTVFRAGDVIQGYRLLEDFRVVGAGLSEWTFAQRAGREYFIKRFLSPTYPDDDAPGSARTKARKRARCAAFEAHHRGIMAAMAPLTSYGGNLIATLDFFREGAKYYKVTEKVEMAGLEPADVARLDFATRLVLLKTAAHSLKILHDLHIVHSDLKPSNILIKRTERGYTTKLIDFDSSYVVGSPPPPEDIIGTMNYYSPELVRYIQGSAHPGELTEASDIFALGLIYTEYLTGAPPPFDPAYHEPAIAVLNGETLAVNPTAAPGPVVTLIDRMMSGDVRTRPAIGEVHAQLMDLRVTPGVTRARAPLPARAPTIPRGAVDGAAGTAGRPAPAVGSALRGKGLRAAASSAADAEAPPAAPAPAPPSETTTHPAVGRRLLGTLLGKLEERRPR
ncbi:MAG TPA: protein kinase [Kineosporiaceae bacterium]